MVISPMYLDGCYIYQWLHPLMCSVAECFVRKAGGEYLAWLGRVCSLSQWFSVFLCFLAATELAPVFLSWVLSALGPVDCRLKVWKKLWTKVTLCSFRFWVPGVLSLWQESDYNIQYSKTQNLVSITRSRRSLLMFYTSLSNSTMTCHSKIFSVL